MRRAIHIAVAALLAAGEAMADGVTGLIEEDFAHSNTAISDGVSERIDADQLVQRYRLTLDRSFFPNLRLNAGGTFEQFNSRSNNNEVSSEASSRTQSFFANLGLTGPILSSALGYGRQIQTAGTATVPFGFTSEDANFLVTWRPTDLPTFSLRLARPSLWDRDHQVQDLTTNQALFTASWTPVRQLDLRYSINYDNPVDRLHETDFRTVSQSGRAGYEFRLLGGRLAMAYGANLYNQQTEVFRSGAGGTVSTPLSPFAGLSLVEAPPATPAQDTLTVNAALINGDTLATAGLNLGSSASIAGDVAFRDLGVQFADAVTSVNTLWIWVDRQLPQALAAGLTWTAWKSDDNLNWTQVPLVGQPVFNAFQPRFELTIESTTARFVKVVARPLPAGATTDPAFKDVLVTELQVLLVTAVSAPGGWQSSTGGTLNATARAQLLPGRVAYDFSFFGTAGTRPGSTVQNTWVVLNGLNYNEQLFNSLLLFNARVARQDQDQSHGHEGQWTWGGSLAATPLPAITGSLVYSGRLDQTRLGDTATNSISLFAQTTPYRGIGLLGNASYGFAQLPTGQHSAVESLTFSGTLQPNQKVTLAANFAHTDSRTSGAGLRSVLSRTNQVDGTVTVNPVRALYLSGGVSYIVGTGKPLTLANGSLSFSPFQGGELQLGVGYTQTLGADGTVTRIFSPGLRWNVHRATLSATFNDLDTSGPAGNTSSRTYGVNLRIPL